MGRRRKGLPVSGWISLDKPLRPDLDPGGEPGAAAVRRPEGRPRRHAGPAGHRHPAHRARRGDQDRPLPGGRRQGLPLHHRLGPHDRQLRPRGRDHRGIRRAARRPRRWPRRCRPSSARSSRSRRPSRRSRWTASAPTTWPAPARTFELAAPPGGHPLRPGSPTRPDADHVTLEIECGKGTYVRAIARDLAEMLGACGHVSALRRTRVGGFRDENAVTLEKLEELCNEARGSEALLPVETALDDIPALAVTDRRRLQAHARTTDRSASPTGRNAERPRLRRGPGPFRPCTRGRLVALCEMRAGRLSPVARLQPL